MRGLVAVILGSLVALAACRAPEAAPSAAGPSAPAAPAGSGAAGPAAAGASGSSAASAATPPKRLAVALSAVNAIAAPLWVAVDDGLFRQEGLEVEVANLDGGSRAVAAIVSGDTPLGVINSGSAVDARLQGPDITMVAGLFDTYYFQIYSQPAIAAPADLRGKTIAASGPRAASERAIIDVLEPYGMEMGRDYQVTYVGSQGGRLAALQQGIVDATIIAPPLGLKAREAGYRELVDLIKLGIPFGHFVITGSDAWLRANPDTVRAFLRAYVTSLALVKRDPEVAKRAIAHYTDTTDPSLLEESYASGIPQLPDVPWVRDDIVRGALATSENPAARDAAPQTFYNNGYLQDLEAAGFFRGEPGR
jgi:NitT/TauT family transport system substrate-binding protein